MRRSECGLKFCGRSFDVGECPQLFIEAEFPGGTRVCREDDLPVAESQFETFRRGRFAKGACGPEWLVVEVNDPLEGRVSLRGRRLLAADGFEIVRDNFLRRRQLLRWQRTW